MENANLFFSGENILDRFLEFMFDQPNSVWVAHNGAKFDTVFILRWLLEKKGVTPPNVVMSGNKIMKLQYKSCHILDSYLFFQMKLAKLPKCMGLNENVEKRLHPYLFTDIDYVGNIVDKKYFDLKSMDEHTKQKFEKWYLSWTGKQHVFKNELFYYCEMDVTTLQKACVKFSQMIHETIYDMVFPFYDLKCMTIASLAMCIFRSAFLKKIYWCVTFYGLS